MPNMTRMDRFMVKTFLCLCLRQCLYFLQGHSHSHSHIIPQF
jgi:hypothetical protein